MTVFGDDVLRATVEMNYPAIGAIQNVYHLINDGSFISEALALDDMIEILEALMVVIAGVIGVLQVVNGVRVINVTSGLDVGFGTFVSGTPFTGVGTVSPTQVALGANFFTERLNVVGRKYFGAPVVGAMDHGGILTAGSLTAIGNAAEDMTELQTATNSEWRFGAIATFDGVFQEFKSYSIPLMAIIQRRRRDTVGI